MDFGGPSGTVIVSRYDSLPEEVVDAADEAGLFTSGLSPSYEIYDRAAFASALSDWGWFGEPTKVPSWFTGRVGAHGGAKKGAGRPAPQHRGRLSRNDTERKGVP